MMATKHHYDWRTVLQDEYPFGLDGILYLVRSGSWAYGLNTPESDQDVRGVALPPAPYLIGLSRWNGGHWESFRSSTCDLLIHSLHRFATLALEGNPQAIETLFVADEDILHLTPYGEMLRKARRRFLSARIYSAFGRYATDKQKAMHRLNTLAAEDPTLYEGVWKNALHLIRGLRMGIEILRNGQVHVRRPDRDELLAIRQGKWSVEQVLCEAERLRQELEHAYTRTPLPPEPDFESVEQLIMTITLDYLKKHMNGHTL